MASLSMFAHAFLGWLAHSQSSTKYSHPSSNDVLLVNKATSKENPDERVHFNSNRGILSWAWLAVKKSYMDVVKAGSNGKQRSDRIRPNDTESLSGKSYRTS
jgi:hypothetical protein